MTESGSVAYELEEGTTLKLDFSKIAKVAEQCPDVIPVAVQNADTKEVILVAYTNREALDRSIRSRIATFWSTSRNELWIKGKGSGNQFELLEVRVNCEQNSLLYMVKPQGGGICHTKNSAGRARDCYYRRLDMTTGDLVNVDP
ncbi:MAG: phosphoribosyl-AMP cyclohydrolase [Thermodesulfobacteriota bacterium]|nr:phosphoribosyl-AMP cyclohydrolase [Thermodesulfobacteriota bacterium]